MGPDARGPADGHITRHTGSRAQKRQFIRKSNPVAQRYLKNNSGRAGRVVDAENFKKKSQKRFRCDATARHWLACYCTYTHHTQTSAFHLQRHSAAGNHQVSPTTQGTRPPDPIHPAPPSHALVRQTDLHPIPPVDGSPHIAEVAAGVLRASHEKHCSVVNQRRVAVSAAPPRAFEQLHPRLRTAPRATAVSRNDTAVHTRQAKKKKNSKTQQHADVCCRQPPLQAHSSGDAY